jgi:hypothetical protein
MPPADRRYLREIRAHVAMFAAAMRWLRPKTRVAAISAPGSQKSEQVSCRKVRAPVRLRESVSPSSCCLCRRGRAGVAGPNCSGRPELARRSAERALATDDRRMVAGTGEPPTVPVSLFPVVLPLVCLGAIPVARVAARPATRADPPGSMRWTGLPGLDCVRLHAPIAGAVGRPRGHDCRAHFLRRCATTAVQGGVDRSRGPSRVRHTRTAVDVQPTARGRQARGPPRVRHARGTCASSTSSGCATRHPTRRSLAAPTFSLWRTLGTASTW